MNNNENNPLIDSEGSTSCCFCFKRSNKKSTNNSNANTNTRNSKINTQHNKNISGEAIEIVDNNNKDPNGTNKNASSIDSSIVKYLPDVDNAIKASEITIQITDTNSKEST